MQSTKAVTSAKPRGTHSQLREGGRTAWQAHAMAPSYYSQGCLVDDTIGETIYQHTYSVPLVTSLLAYRTSGLPDPDMPSQGSTEERYRAPSLTAKALFIYLFNSNMTSFPLPALAPVRTRKCAPVIFGCKKSGESWRLALCLPTMHALHFFGSSYCVKRVSCHRSTSEGYSSILIAWRILVC